MIIFVTLLIIVAIVVIGYYIYPLIKEESATIKEEINEAKKEEESKKNQHKNITSLKNLVAEKSIEEILSKISDDPRKIQRLKEFLQDELKEAMRQKNPDKIRECNRNLKAVQVAENNLKGN